MRKALSTLPWVEQGTIKPDVDSQTVTFAFQNPKDFDLRQVKETIEGQTKFTVGKVLEQD